MNDNISLFWKSLYEIGITNKNNIMREALRVKKTASYIEGDINDEEEIYSTMKNKVEKELGYFPGDKDTFIKLFKIGWNFDIIEFTIETYKSDRTKMVIVPDYLIESMNKVIEDKDPNNILIGDAEKTLVGLEGIIKNFPNKKFTLLTEQKLMYDVLSFVFDKFKNVEVINQSILRRLNLEEKYDLIFSLPAFATKLYKNNLNCDFITKEIAGIAIENFLNQISENGLLYIIVPARVTFAGKEFSDLRNYIMDNYNLDSIYTIPDGAFKPYTSSRTYLLCISNVKKESLLLGNLELKDDHIEKGYSKSMDMSEFRKFDEWRIELILTEECGLIQKYKESSIDKVKLADIADIFRGKMLTKNDAAEGEIYVLNISNIENGEIVFDGMDTIDENDRKIKRYELLKGDVVITCRGTVTKVALFNGWDKTVIASSNIIVIRPKSDILSDYLKIFLESPLGTTLIKSFQGGTSVMNINPSDIGEMEIPLLPLEKQQELVDKYKAEFNVFKATIYTANKNWSNVKNDIYNSMIE